MAERERSHTRPLGGVFVAHSQVLTAADVQRALTRMAHEVVERNGGLSELRATQAVVLAAGGFEANQQMRERYLEAPGHWRCSAPNKLPWRWRRPWKLF